MSQSTGSGSAGSQTTQLSSLRHSFQRLAYRRILVANAPCPVQRTRCKLQRWRLTEPHCHPRLDLSIRHLTPEWMSRRALASLLLLAKVVPPRVSSAVFSTMWNRWTTHRRFQRRSGPSNQCTFKCSATAEDSLEHYARCPRTRELAERYLRIPSDLHCNLYSFNLCNPHIRSIEDLSCVALMIYSVYRLTQKLRHHPLQQNASVYDALVQMAREGARGHRQASRTIDTRWSSTVPLGTRLCPLYL